MSLQGIRGRVKNAGIVMSVAVGMFMLVMTAFVPVNAEGTRDITITPENYDGGKAIQEALDEQKGGKDVYEGPAYDLLTITLTPGTYTITESLLIYDNTRLEASGATVNYSGKNSTGTGSRVKQPLLSNYCSGRGGYTGASNISVNGGDWDFQGREGEVNYEYSCEAFRFMHGSNFTFSNLVMTHLYESHYITIEGVENVNITGCTFKNQTNIDAKKEAIHIDCMNNPSIAPSNQDNTIYDDTYCNNITVDGCAFISVPRGVGTHIAVKGIYPSNINITNNLFEKITYEAVKAYHYKNLNVSGNSIVGAALGIKVYLYAEPSDNDKDEEGDSNYLNPLGTVPTEGVPANLNTVISNNTIMDIKDDKIAFGINISGCEGRVMNGLTVKNNTIGVEANNYATDSFGIYMKYAANSTIYGNTLKRTKDMGVYVVNCKNSKIQSNTITDVNTTAIKVSFGDLVEVADNEIKAAAKNSISVDGGRRISVRKNHVFNSGECGLYAVAVPELTVSSNVLSNSKVEGISINKRCHNTKITGNFIDGSGDNAIYVISANNVQLSSNSVSNSKKYGIYLKGINTSKLLKNDISDTKKAGISVNGGKDNKINKNVVNDIKDIGILVSDCKRSNVNDNTLTNTGGYGILLTKSKKCFARRNKLYDVKNAYAICYATTTNPRKNNLKCQSVKVMRKKRLISGKSSKQLKVLAAYKKKRIKAKVYEDGSFEINMPKMKKKKEVTIIIKDNMGNRLIKTV